MLVKTYPLSNNRKLEIHTDDIPDSPRGWDNNGTMVCFHKRYDLGDKHGYKSSDFSGWDELEAHIREDHDVVVILPLYLMDHSGITIRTNSDQFRACDSAGWDWGQVGFIFASRESLKNGGHPDDVDIEKVETWLRGEVKTYDQYLRGDIYGFQVRELCEHCGSDGDVVDSGWGFYGSDPLENGIADHLSEGDRDTLKRHIEKKH